MWAPMLQGQLAERQGQEGGRVSVTEVGVLWARKVFLGFRKADRVSSHLSKKHVAYDRH